MSGRRVPLRDQIALALLGLALAMRVLVPAGWMPAQQGQGFAITMCSGSGTESVWVDTDGKVHKQAPAQTGDPQCAFAGMGLAMLGSEFPPAILSPVPADAAPARPLALASIGHGLAAPPPPATGPPVTV